MNRPCPLFTILVIFGFLRSLADRIPQGCVFIVPQGNLIFGKLQGQLGGAGKRFRAPAVNQYNAILFPRQLRQGLLSGSPATLALPQVGEGGLCAEKPNRLR